MASCLGKKKILFIKLQETVSVADIVLWAALYPVLSDSSITLGKYTGYMYSKSLHLNLSQPPYCVIFCHSYKLLYFFR